MMNAWCIDNGLPLNRSRLSAWLQMLRDGQVLYLLGLPGLGKKTNAKALVKLDEGLALRYISALDDNYLDRAKSFINHESDPNLRYLLILDDLIFYGEDEIEKWIDSWLFRNEEKPPNVSVILISTMKLPRCFTKYALEKRLMVIDTSFFLLEEQEIELMLHNEPWSNGVDDIVIKARARECFNLTGGYPLAIRSYVHHMTTSDPPLNRLNQLILDDVLSVLLNDRICRSDNRIRRILATLSVFPWYSSNMAKDLLGETWQQDLEHLHDRFAAIEETENGYHFMPFVQEVLQKGLDEFYDKDTKRALFTKAGAINKKYGRQAERLKCYMQAGDKDEVLACLIVLTKGLHYQSVRLFVEERMLDSYPRAMEIQIPELLVARAILAFVEMKTLETDRYISELEEKCFKELGETSPDKKYDHTKRYICTLLSLPHVSLNHLTQVLKIIQSIFSANKDLVELKELYEQPAYFNLLSASNGEYLTNPQTVTKLDDLLGKEIKNKLKILLSRYCLEMGKKARAIAYISHALHDPEYKPILQLKVKAEMGLVRIQIADGETEQARRLLESLVAESERYDDIDTRGTLLAALTLIDIHESRVDRVRSWLETEERDPLEPVIALDFFRMSIQALAYMMTGNNKEAFEKLIRFEVFAEAYPHSYIYIGILILKSIALYRLHDNWQQPLTTALTLAAPFDVTQMFADQGKALLPLWTQLTPNDATEKNFHKKVLQGLIKMAEHYPKYLESKEVETVTLILSKREMQVLRLIREGKKNSEISDELFISIATVKYHIANILKKLGAANRTDAVRRAQELFVI